MNPSTSNICSYTVFHVEVEGTHQPSKERPITGARIRTILHADLDAFYASVEQRDDPALRGRPVLVGMGVVTAASYEAKRRGVRCPCSIAAALSICPDAIVVAARMKAYSEASAAVFDIFRDATPEVEGLSIDEAFLDVTGMWRLSGDGRAIATALRQRVAREVGLPLSVGVATTKHLAKVASAEAKPDGLLVVEPGREAEFLHPLPVEVLWGVGPVTAQKLRARGLQSVADIAKLEEEHLISALGGAVGRHLYDLAHNRDPRHVDTGRRRRSIGSQSSFPSGRISRSDCDAILLNVVDRVTARMRTAERVGRTVVLRLRYGDFTAATRSHTLAEASNSTSTILEPAQHLLRVVWPETQQRGLTRIGLSVTSLSSASSVQLALPFGGRDTTQLDLARDAIHKRFGNGSLLRARNLGRAAFETPMLPD